jgi:streptogramin lyase
MKSISKSLLTLVLAMSFSLLTSVPMLAPSPVGADIRSFVEGGLPAEIPLAQRNDSPVSLFDTPPAPTEFSIPTANSRSFQTTAGPDGNFWFCETRVGKIGRVTTSGVFTEFPLAADSVPYAITTGPDNNLWFTEQNANKIGKITTSGVVTDFPIPTAGSRPFGITPGADGSLWFAEATGNKIGKITTTGTTTEFPVPTPNSAPFQLTPGPDGNVWFTEQAASKIGKITPAGVITEYQIPTPNSFAAGITTGPDGNLWFTEYGANKIGRVNTSGSFMEFNISNPNSFPFAITPAADGNLYYTQQGTRTIQAFNPNTLTFGFSLTTSTGPSGIVSLPLTNPHPYLGYLTADDNKFGFVLIAAPPCHVVPEKPPERFFDAQGKKVAIAVGHSNCKPSATTDADWIKINEIGFVPETNICAIDYTVDPNTSTEPRTATIEFGDVTLTIHQAGAGSLPSVNVSPGSARSGGSGVKVHVTPAGRAISPSDVTGASAFTGTTMVGWNGEGRPTTLVSGTELTADISADDIATPGTANITVFDVSSGGGTSPLVTFTIEAGPDFTISLEESTVNATPGTKVKVHININRTGGFAGSVTITPPDSAGGIKSKPKDATTTTDSSVSYKLKVGDGATPGPHQFVFKGTDDSGRVRTATITVVVQP